MTLDELLRTSPETLAQRQYQALRAAVVGRLEHIANLIREDRLDEITQYFGYSPAGDGHGRDNSYIDFKDLCGKFEDIDDVVNYLVELRNLSE